MFLGNARGGASGVLENFGERGWVLWKIDDKTICMYANVCNICAQFVRLDQMFRNFKRFFFFFEEKRRKDILVD